MVLGKRRESLSLHVHLYTYSTVQCTVPTYLYTVCLPCTYPPRFHPHGPWHGVGVYRARIGGAALERQLLLPVNQATKQATAVSPASHYLRRRYMYSTYNLLGPRGSEPPPVVPYYPYHPYHPPHCSAGEMNEKNMSLVRLPTTPTFPGGGQHRNHQPPRLSLATAQPIPVGGRR